MVDIVVSGSAEDREDRAWGIGGDALHGWAYLCCKILIYSVSIFFIYFLKIVSVLSLLYVGVSKENIMQRQKLEEIKEHQHSTCEPDAISISMRVEKHHNLV